LASYGTLWRFFHRHKITSKKTEHGTEQDRPDIVNRREPGSIASWNLDPDRLVFNTETLDLDERLASLRKGTEWPDPQSRRSLMCTGIPRPSSTDCTLNGMVAPLVLDGPTNGSAFKRTPADLYPVPGRVTRAGIRESVGE
jgi:hypothetical protein